LQSEILRTNEEDIKINISIKIAILVYLANVPDLKAQTHRWWWSLGGGGDRGLNGIQNVSLLT